MLIRIAGGGRARASSTPPAKQVLEALAASYAENPVVESSSEIVGPMVGAELRQKAIQLTVLGLLFQLIYIAFRFKGGDLGRGGHGGRASTTCSSPSASSPSSATRSRST